MTRRCDGTRSPIHSPSKWSRTELAEREWDFYLEASEIPHGRKAAKLLVLNRVTPRKLSNLSEAQADALGLPPRYHDMMTLQRRIEKDMSPHVSPDRKPIPDAKQPVGQLSVSCRAFFVPYKDMYKDDADGPTVS